MRSYLPQLLCAGMLIVLTLAIRALLRAFLQAWWEKPHVRLFCKWLPGCGLLCAVLWTIGAAVQNYELIRVGASLVVVSMISAAMLLAALPFAIILHKLHARRAPRQAQRTNAAPVLSRREFLRSAAASLPAVSVLSGWSGIAESFETVRVPLFNFKFPELPPALSGLKICQLSDLHLGYFRGLREMEKLFEQITTHRPDLVLVTGDVADDLALLPEFLRMLAALKPRLGVYASLGNHEYYRGIKTVRKHFDASTIPLLCAEGFALPVREATLFIGGADDPSRARRTDMKDFLQNSVTTTLASAPAEAFTILMSHRPQGFYSAAEIGAHLTLSGHTHGMQVGYNNRSLFELNGGEKLLWGHYQRGKSQLYTSSGVGHWFPFRLGCPPEAPIIVLE